MQNDHFAADVLDVLAQMKRVQGNFAEQAANARAEARVTSVEKVDGMASTRGSYERALAYSDASVQMLASIGHMKEVLAYREGSEDERTEHAEKSAANRDDALTGILDTLKRERGAEWEEGQVLVSTGESGPFIGYYAGYERVATVMVQRDGKQVPMRAPFENLREATEQEKAAIDPYHPLNLDPIVDAIAADNPPAPLKRGPRFGVDFGHLSSDAEQEADAADEQANATPDTQATYAGTSPEPIRMMNLTGDAATAAVVGAAHPELPSYTDYERPEQGDRVVAITDSNPAQRITGEYVGLNGDMDPIVRADNGMEWPVSPASIQPANRRAE